MKGEHEVRPYTYGGVARTPTFLADLRNGNCELARETLENLFGIVRVRNSDAQHENWVEDVRHTFAGGSGR